VVAALSLSLGCKSDPPPINDTPRVVSGAGGGWQGTGGSGGGGGGGGGGSATTCPPGATGPIPALKLTQVTSGLDKPLFVTAAPGDTDRLYVVEQHGTIRVLRDGALAPFLDITSLVGCCDERGLLGLAFHPGYARNGRFFVNYTDKGGDTVIAEYARSNDDPGIAAPEATKVVLGVAQPFANHNGGMIAFGPDGYLYIGMGDGGSAHDPMGNGQNPLVKLGKMLRVDVDTYPAPPAGNLPGADPDVWDYGLRNPWRFSFDRCTGDLYIGDVGQDAWEEIDVEPAESGHRNYGWDRMEASHCHEPSRNCDSAGLTLPVVEYGHGPSCSVTGGYVYRGARIPNLVGAYLYADYCSGKIWYLKLSDGVVTATGELTTDLLGGRTEWPISSFGEDGSGELYVVVYDGAVYRIDAE